MRRGARGGLGYAPEDLRYPLPGEAASQRVYNFERVHASVEACDGFGGEAEGRGEFGAKRGKIAIHRDLSLVDIHGKFWR